MNERSKYLMKNTAIFAIGSFGTKLISFFLVPFYTYVLSKGEYGTTDLIFTISTVIVPLIMFNLGEAVRRFSLDKDVDHKKIFDISLLVVIFGIVISLLIFPIAGLFPIIADYRTYMYFYIVLFAVKQIALDFLRGREQLKLYAISNILYSFLIAILNIIFLVTLKMGIEGYLMAYILSELLTIIFMFIFGKMYIFVGKIKLDTKLAKKMIMFSLAVIPNSLLWWVINSSDRVMVTAMCDVAENGILAVGYKLPSILTMVNTVFLQAWQYSAIREKDSDTKDEYTNHMLEQFFKASVLVAASMILVIKPMTGILFESSYYNSWESSAFLLLGFVFMGVGTFVGTIYYVEKNMVGNMLSAVSGAIVNLILNFLLIPSMGAAGATLAACVSYAVILIYRYFDTKKYQNIKLFRKDYIAMTILLVIMTAGNFVKNIFGVGLAVVSYLIILLLNYTYIKEMIVNFLRNIKNKLHRNR